MKCLTVHILWHYKVYFCYGKFVCFVHCTQSGVVEKLEAAKAVLQTDYEAKVHTANNTLQQKELLLSQVSLE